MPRHPRSRGHDRYGPEALLERARRWSDASVTYDRTTDVSGRCPHCAIHLLAPTCDHCGCRIIGHGVEDAEGRMYCCAHCARKVGVSELRA